MSSRDDSSDDTSFALTIYEKKTLEESRSYSKKYKNEIAKAKTDFAKKGRFRLWWDAYGIFNSSDPKEVTAFMEKFRELFEEIDDFTAQVEKGDPKSYERLITLSKKIKDKEIEARRVLENTKSSAVYKMLREFLEEKFNLDHNMKKVECIVLNQRMKEVTRTCQSSSKAVEKMNETMDKLINVKSGEMEALKETIRKERQEAEQRAEAIRRKCDARLQQVLKEAEEKADDRIREMKEENEKLRFEADEKLRKAVEEANRRSETRVQAMAEQNQASLQEMMKMLTMRLPTNGATE